MDKLKVVGKSVPLVDGREKVTGEAEYTSDLTFPQMLWGRLLRSPLPHAKILNVDTSRASRVAGVRAILTGKDTPFLYGVTHRDLRPLQDSKVRHVGDPVAAVAAVDFETAEEALELIKVDYEELPYVVDAEKALHPEAPVIHEGLEGNVVARSFFESGDIMKAFAEADYLFEDRFETQRIAHACAEPHNCIAKWDSSGNLSLFASSQSPSLDRKFIAELLNIPESKVRVVTGYVGGGFGSKVMSRLPINIVAVLLSRKACRPVKMQLTRDEEFIFSTFAHKMIINVTTSLRKGGTISGRYFKVICDCGAYSTYAPVIIEVGGALQGILYAFKDYKYEGCAVYTNLPYGGAFRGVGNPQVHFAGETQLNMIADRLDIDPLDLRMKNAIRTGEKTAVGARVISCGLSQCLEAAARQADWKVKRANASPNRGIGLACNVHFTGARLRGMPDADFASASATLNDDGSVSLATSCVDIGQGSNTVMAQIAAETLGTHIESIRIISGDTDACPMGWGTRGSRNTAIGGMAVKKAAENIRGQILSVAGEKLKVNKDDLEIQNGRVFLKTGYDSGLSFSDVAQLSRYRENGQAIMSTGYWDAPSHGNISFTFSFGVKVVELEVDPDTGQIKILEVAAAQDFGKAINPMAAAGQINGAVVQGLSVATSEEILLDDMGNMQNPSYLDYKILTSLDIPSISHSLVETNDPVGPYGAKGLGEMALIGIPEAVVGAIHDASGTWITNLPVTAEKLLFALKEKS
jgi:putative selenate reductase molybdopterin-binding subunit